MNVVDELERYGLTPLQEGMLFHHLGDPHDDVHVVQVSCRVRGAVEIARLREAARRLASSHAVFRTAIHWAGLARPVQVVYCEAEPIVVERSLEDMAPEQQARLIDEFMREDRAAGFALDRAPLLRFALFRLTPTESRLVWTLHHIILDAWSTPRVFSELFAHYSSNAVSAPPSRFREYADWVGWQDTSAARAFWKAELRGVRGGSLSAITRTREARAAAPGTLTQVERHGAGGAARLRAFARRAGVTVNTAAQGAWALALAKHAHAKEVVFGSSVSVRPESVSDVENVVGMCLNTLPVRANFAQDGPIGVWLKQLQLRQAMAREHSAVSLADILADQRPDVAGELFESVFVCESHPWTAAIDTATTGLVVDEITVHERTHCPLTLMMRLDGSDLRFKLIHDSARASRAVADRLADAFAAQLEELSTLPADARISTLLELPASERRRVLEDFNTTARPYPRDASVDGLVRRQAEATPDAIALRCGSEQVSYRELESRANRIAHALHARGVRPGQRVGLHVERSIQVVTCLLAILKAGAAYVPLDPSYPVERLRAMIEASGVSLVIAAEPGSLDGAASILLADLEAEADRAPSSTIESQGGEAVAYVTYTSGSTGQPKGVVIPHRAVIRLVTESTFVSLSARDVVLNAAPLTFDASTFEIWGPLARGAQVAIVAGRHASLADLGRVIREQRVTVAWLTAGLFNLFVEHRLDDLAPLEQLLTGGEAMSSVHAERAMQAHPRLRLSNAYGPTESTTFACSHLLAPGLSELVPIGAPITNTSVFVLDAALNPVGIGVEGELYIGGDGLAHGYDRKPALTAERFIPNAFSSARGARLYRTGDRARWRDDGAVEFLGRTDHQVKLRGFRIELGEIEAVARRHEAVTGALAVVTEVAPGDRRLCLYVTGGDALSTDTRDLAKHLGSCLPDFMVPSILVPLAAFPLDPNGKVDRAALPAPFERTPTTESCAAATATERALIAIWADVLSSPEIGADQDLLRAGAHSLHVLQVAARISATLAVEVPVRRFFEERTVAAQARVVDALRAAPAVSDATITPVARGRYRVGG